jgi:hypothetical protein
MRGPMFLCRLAPFLVLVLTTSAVELHNLKVVDDDTPVSVFIGFRGGPSSSLAASKLAASYSIQSNAALKRVNAGKATLTPSQIEQLTKDGENDILYIENDPPRYLHAVTPAEVIPWGIKAVQATSNTVPPPPPNANKVASCSDPNSFKIAVVDTGLDVHHPDIPCFNVGSNDTNCIGKSFGNGTGAWDDPRLTPHPLLSHGKFAAVSVLVPFIVEMVFLVALDAKDPLNYFLFTTCVSLSGTQVTGMLENCVPLLSVPS